MLTSCAMFSVLMVGFIPRRAEPITIDLPDRIESTEDINHRDVVIRHIGMSIVVSVGTGITTAELIRKWGRSREAALEGLEASPKLRLQVADWQPASLLAAHEQYQTCRITLPDAPERVLAIFLGGQYYRFVKRVVDRNQAFRLVERLDQRGEPAVITETGEHYAVWALAPEACSEPTAFIGADA